MSNILDKVKNNNKTSNLSEALEEQKTLNPKESKGEKINVSYTVDQTNDIKLRTFVLKEKLKNIKGGNKSVSASSIVNQLIADFLKDKK